MLLLCDYILTEYIDIDVTAVFLCSVLDLWSSPSPSKGTAHVPVSGVPAPRNAAVVVDVTVGVMADVIVTAGAPETGNALGDSNCAPSSLAPPPTREVY